jgi:hypothetical protein
MRLKRSAVVAFVAALHLAVPLNAGEPQATGPFGIYGYVRRVVREPDASNPTRIQIWGTFSISVSRFPGEYHAPERGYLYFERSSGDDATLAEWAELQQLADTGGPWINAVGKYGITGFTRQDVTARVRTSDEKPANPDPYRGGRGVVKVSYGNEPSAVKMLGSLPLPRSRVNYGFVDKVIVERDPQRIQIWGMFSMGETDFYSFAPPRSGYLYLAPDATSESQAAVNQEWFRWMKLANTGVLAFFTFNFPDYTVRVRPSEEPPDKPDVWSMRVDSSTIRPDTTYLPIRTLLKAR